MIVTKTKAELVVRPLGDRLLVRRDEIEDKSPGGIIYTDQHKAANKTRKGTVLAVGPGKKLDQVTDIEVGDGERNEIARAKRLPMDVAVGDRVYFTQWAGSELDDEDKLLVMLREEEVLGVIEGE